MIRHVDGKEYFCYAVVSDCGTMIGFDPRPIAELETEWLGKWRVTGEKIVQIEQAANLAVIKFNKAAQEIGEFSSEEPELERRQPLTPTAPEVFRLRGIDGRGGLCVMADRIRGLGHALGTEARMLYDGLFPKTAVRSCAECGEELKDEARDWCGACLADASGGAL